MKGRDSMMDLGRSDREHLPNRGLYTNLLLDVQPCRFALSKFDSYMEVKMAWMPRGQRAAVLV